MAGISKNSRRGKVDQTLYSKWGGKIQMHTIFEGGKMKHYAQCDKTGNTARKPKQLM